MKRLLLFVSILFSIGTLSAQTIEGGAGVCYVTGDPDDIASPSDIQTPTLTECNVAFDRTNQILYLYDPSGGAGDKWNGYALDNVTNTNTQVTNVDFSGTTLSFDVTDLVNSTVTEDAFSVDIAAIQDGVVTAYSATGTGATRTITLTRSLGGDVTGTINVEDDDADPTNELTTVTQNATEPSSPKEGDIWIDTDDDNTVYVHNGTSFVQMSVDDTNTYITALEAQSDGTIQATLSDASTFIIDLTNAPTVETTGELNTLITNLGVGETGIAVAAQNNTLGIPATANWGGLFMLKK